MFVITAELATAVCIGFTLIYVAGFYLFKTPGNRNDPPVILARMKAVSVASVLSAGIVWCLLKAAEAEESSTVALGLEQPTELMYTLNRLRPLLLTCMLFLGPLSIMFFDQELIFQKNFDFNRDVVASAMSLLGQRNYIVAPLTEEFVFRACMIAVLHQARFSRTYLIFVSPLYFGIAHLHHAWENYNNLGRNRRALQHALLSSLFQFTYTTLFGWYASYLFLRMGNLWPPVLCHSFCNMMGFPDFSDIQHRSKFQKVVIWCCFPLGVVLFVTFLDVLTLPSSVGGSMYWK